MRFLFLLFFGFLLYRFLIKPILIGVNEKPRYRNPQQDMAEMLRRMQEFQQKQYAERHHYQQEQQAPLKKQPKGNKNDGEYIDYEELD
jgi:hypothetical protein